MATERLQKIHVGILGATGLVGQRFISLLHNHPWFELTWLGASSRSAGKPYREAAVWRIEGEMPSYVRDTLICESTPNGAPKLIFSAMDASVATQVEQAFAAGGHTIVSNSRNHRMDDDVPLLVPEINPHHLNILHEQRRRRKWQGQIVTNPNCAAVVLVMALAPLSKFGIKRVVVSTMQAISGAGYPGLSSMDITANVIPFIGGGEEEKIEQETQKILGSIAGNAIEPHPVEISAHCSRVPVADGHTVVASVEFEKKPAQEELLNAWRDWRGLPQEKCLPTAPSCPIIYMDEKDRPQARYDVNRENGMAVFVGRLRPCPVLHYKFVALGHNTVRGAAGAALLNAELMKTEGWLNQ